MPTIIGASFSQSESKLSSDPSSVISSSIISLISSANELDFDEDFLKLIIIGFKWSFFLLVFILFFIFLNKIKKHFSS